MKINEETQAGQILLALARRGELSSDELDGYTTSSRTYTLKATNDMDAAGLVEVTHYQRRKGTWSMPIYRLTVEGNKLAISMLKKRKVVA